MKADLGGDPGSPDALTNITILRFVDLTATLSNDDLDDIVPIKSMHSSSNLLSLNSYINSNEPINKTAKKRDAIN